MEIEKVLPLQFLKKSPFFGSWNQINYRFQKEEDQLVLCVYPGPYSFDFTPEEQKQYFSFPFSEEGYDQAIAKLNEVYREMQ